MTSLQPRSARARTTPTAPVETDPRHRRPLVLATTLGGVAAAASTLVVCLALGVLGWFLTDAGAHGTPSDGLRVGALGWLLAHGSGVRISGVALSAAPLGLTLVAAWATWRVGHRVGESISGHGPDADRIADGERDWTVPTAAGLFTIGYVVVAVVTTSLAATADTAPSGGRVIGWSLVLCLAVGAPAIAIGAGRAAIWAAIVPESVRDTAFACRRILTSFTAVAATVLVIAVLADLGSAATMVSRLHADAGATIMLIGLSLAVLPNAVAFSGSYLLGPGFAVGANTLVAPTAVVLGPLPLFPLLAGLPDPGPTAGWTAALMALPLLVAAAATARSQRLRPTLRWDVGALRGCVAGVVAGVVVGIVAGLAGGAVGPGRMRSVGPFAFDAMVHAITAFGIGGLLGGLAMTWWQRRTARSGAGVTAAR